MGYRVLAREFLPTGNESETLEAFIPTTINITTQPDSQFRVKEVRKYGNASFFLLLLGVEQAGQSVLQCHLKGDVIDPQHFLGLASI